MKSCIYKRSLWIILLMILPLSAFEYDHTVIPAVIPPYAVIEKTIRSKFDSYAVFTWSEYNQLLTKLSSGKFIVLPLNEMNKRISSSRVIVGLRHDVDLNPFKALEMANIEKIHQIRASYYFLATAEYSGEIRNSALVRPAGIGQLIQEIHQTGAEIGIHNDLLTVMVKHNIDPFVFNRMELDYYRSLRIKIWGTASHGSPLAKMTVPNHNIFSDFARQDSILIEKKKYPLGSYSLREYGFEYEAYDLKYDLYFSESGGKWNDPDGLQGVLNKLDSSKPGQRIQILVHPEWWGKI